jgi:hypothetical protein
MKLMMKTLFLLGIACVLGIPAHGQANTLYNTTLSAAVKSTDQSICLTSTTNLVVPSASAVGSLLMVDREAMQVVGPLLGSCFPVLRGVNGSPTQAHLTGIWVWFGDPTWFINKESGTEQWGASCTAANIYASPIINTRTGNWEVCDATSHIAYAGPWGDGGSFIPAVTNVADAAYSALAQDSIIVYTSISTTRLVTLPAATALPGKMYVIKNGTATGDTIEVATVDGSATHACETTTAYGSCKVWSNGTVWFTIP